LKYDAKAHDLWAQDDGPSIVDVRALELPLLCGLASECPSCSAKRSLGSDSCSYTA
jgi:hypothetical protein